MMHMQVSLVPANPIQNTVDGKIPTRGSKLAAGLDLYSSVEVIIPARGQVLVPTGIRVALPPGTYGQIAPRSGLALRHRIGIGGGVIDEDYRGEVGVIMQNNSDLAYLVKPYDRIAQFLILPCLTTDFELQQVDCLPASGRGADGFGSSGV